MGGRRDFAGGARCARGEAYADTEGALGTADTDWRAAGVRAGRALNACRLPPPSRPRWSSPRGAGRARDRAAADRVLAGRARHAHRCANGVDVRADCALHADGLAHSGRDRALITEHAGRARDGAIRTLDTAKARRQAAERRREGASRAFCAARVRRVRDGSPGAGDAFRSACIAAVQARRTRIAP